MGGEVLLVEEPPAGGTAEGSHAASQFGPYLLKRLLSRGGFGEVYEAFDTNKNRTVALKVLPSSYSADPVFRQRLFREASTAGRLSDPHVVPIHDYGEIDGQLFIDMRLIRGTDLRTVLDESGPLEPERAVSIVGQIASALDAAHAEQIVHRDVKPANILLTPKDFACLADFGLANAATDAKVTTIGTTVGTFAYMAPERFADEETDHRADIYALACVLYECLTGTPPYPAGDRTALIAAHLTAPIPRPSQQGSQIRPRFDEVIARGLAKSPEDRYASAGELAEAARHALAPAPRPIAATPAVTEPASPQTPRRGRTALIAAAGVVALLAVTGVAYQINRRHGEQPAASNSSAITATIPVGKHPQGVAVDPTTHTAYVANYGDNTLSVIDTTSRIVTGTIPVGQHPQGVAVDPTTHTVCATNNRDDTVSVVDAASRTVRATIPVGTNPWGVAVDPTTHTAYVSNNWDNSVSVIDLTTDTVVATIPVGINPYGMAVDPTTHTAYVANSDNAVSVIDGPRRVVATTIKIGSGNRGVAVDPRIHTAYVANSDNTVFVIDTGSRAVTGTIKVGNGPRGVAIDPGANTAYTINSDDNTVSVIDTTRRAVAATITVGEQPERVAVDPVTHTAFTTNSDDTLSVIESAP